MTMRCYLKILLLLLFPLMARTQEDPPQAFIKKYNDAKTDGEKGRYIIHSIQEDTGYQRTLKNFLYYFSKQNDQVGIDYVRIFVNMNQNAIGEFTNSLKDLFEILARFKKRKDKYGEMWTLSQIANTFGTAKNFDTAVVYYKNVLGAALALNDTNRYVNSLNDIGYTYYQANNPDSGLVYAKLAVEISYEPYFAGFLPYALSTLGENYIAKKQYDSALVILRECLGYLVYDTLAISGISNDIAECFMEINKKDSVIYYTQQVISIANRNNLKPDLLRCYENLYRYFDKLKMMDSSNKYFRLATNIKDSLYSIEKLKLVQEITFNEQLKNQEEIQKQRAQQNRIKVYSLIFALALLLVIAIVLYRNNQQKQKAKVKIEKAYSELKATQQQLIQSEKMASLGELTAGIAHEIQNPLNFVNNFSDVNTELVDEAAQEIDKGNIDEVKAILNYIKDNEQKINHHGKRADSIVKGMLQHSRTSSGQKELTDINALADEYLRLAYHGLRAKDKSFTAITKTEFDNSLGKINVVPQEIGRVILNLINNAFYAVDEKKKQNLNGYGPTVSVSTKKANGKVEIKVADNGNGIPQKVLDKIFQPFFTTKPTGQGTGLGLSLAYDIVTKGHGGELKVETKEREGSTFTIILPV